MDLTLSKAGDHAVRAAIALAGVWGDGRFVTIDDVAEEMDLPRSYTPQILGMLARAGLAESKPGRGGGYRLSRSPAKISLLEVVEAAEGPIGTTRCPLAGGPCRWDDACAVHATWHKATEGIRNTLQRSSLEEVARADRELGVGRRRRHAVTAPRDQFLAAPLPVSGTTVHVTDAAEIDLKTAGDEVRPDPGPRQPIPRAAADTGSRDRSLHRRG